MKVQYKNQAVEQVLVSINLFVFFYGFDEPLLPAMFLHIAQMVAGSDKDLATLPQE